MDIANPRGERKLRGDRRRLVSGQLIQMVGRCTTMLSFQRLDVYQRAIQFLAFASELVEELPRGNAQRAEQLISAAEAVVRNIAEGAGRWSRVDMSKHYKIARGEAMECAASLDVFKVRCLIKPPRYDRGMELLEAIVAMLTKMITVESSA